MQVLADARYGRIGVTVAVLAALLVIAVGGGYSASKAFLTDGTAYAVDGVGIDRLNAATGAPDAEILDLAMGPNPVRVIHRDNRVYLVDTIAGTVTRLDPATLELGDSATGPGGKGAAVEVVTGGGATALVDLLTGVLQRVDPVALSPIGRSIRVSGSLTGAVADSKGTLWVGAARSGELLRIDKAGKVTPVPVAPNGASVTVTLVGDAPVVLADPGSRVTAVDPDSLRRSRTVTIPRSPAGAVWLSSADTPLPDLWALDVAASALYRIDLAKGTVDGPVTIGAGEVEWGPPVVHAGRVYVPDLADHRIVAVDARSLNRLEELVVPGNGPSFTVTVEGGAMWANDPTNGRALVVDQEGETREVGKGDGQGRLDPVPVGLPAEVPPTSPAALVEPPLDLTRQPPGTPPQAPPPSPAPSVATPAPPADSLVPDVGGLERGAACAALSTVGLGCDTTTDDGGAVGKVSKQDPAPGRTLPPGGSVRITVGEGVEVPALTGRSVEAACGEVRDARLTCVRQAVTLERGKARDEVFGQDPAPGTRVDQDSTVLARYWGDPRVLDVPDVTGDTPKAACDALAAAGFTCKEIAGTGRPLGRVVTQAPAAGRADEGSEVAVTVAMSTTMPNLVDGSSLTVCNILTRDLGLPAANCSKAAVDAQENPADTVKATTPAAGATVTLSTLVSYVRRTGLVRVPSVSGRTATEACSAIRAAGLGACTQSNAGEGPPGSLGTVESQQPAAGAMVPPGDPVNVAVYSAQRVVVPPVSGDIDAACGTITAAGLACNAVPANTGAYRQVAGQSPAGGTQVSAGSTVTVSYEPSVRKPLRRFRRGTTGTETDTWALTAFAPGEDYHNILLGAGFFEDGPICNAYSDPSIHPGRIQLVDWITPDGPGGPVHHSVTTSETVAPGGSGWTVNHPRTAVVAVNGPVTVYVVVRGFGHYFTPDLGEANSQVSSGRFLAGPFASFTCW